MEQTLDMAQLLQIIVGFLLLAVAAGMKWAQLQARTEKHPHALAHEKAANGGPSLGELSRRVAALEDDRRTYVREAEFREFKASVDRDRDGVWSAVKDLRAMDNAQQRRIDGIVGQA